MTPPVERFTDYIGSISTATVDGVDTDYPTPRVTVHLTVGEIPMAVSSAINDVTGRITGAKTHGPDQLAITVAVPERWKDGGPRTVRAIGSSTGLTLPPEALDASGITEDTQVDVHARPGELHIRDHTEGPRLP